MSPSKRDIVIDHGVQERTLRGDYNLSEGSVISVGVTTVPTSTVEKISQMQKAQESLRRAITDAQNMGAHVIITLGSCLQASHGDDTS